jgi:hypothetical protein
MCSKPKKNNNSKAGLNTKFNMKLMERASQRKVRIKHGLGFIPHFLCLVLSM